MIERVHAKGVAQEFAPQGSYPGTKRSDDLDNNQALLVNGQVRGLGKVGQQLHNLPKPREESLHCFQLNLEQLDE